MADSNTPDKATPSPRAPIRAIRADFNWISMHPAFSGSTSSNFPSPQIVDRRLLSNPNHASSFASNSTGASARPLRPPLPIARRPIHGSSSLDIFNRPSTNPNSNPIPSNPFGPTLQPNIRPPNTAVQDDAFSHKNGWGEQFRAPFTIPYQPAYQSTTAPTQQIPIYQARPEGRWTGPPSDHHSNLNPSERSASESPRKRQRGGRQKQSSTRNHARSHMSSNSFSLDIDPRLIEFDDETEWRRSESRATSEISDMMGEDRYDLNGSL